MVEVIREGFAFAIARRTMPDLPIAWKSAYVSGKDGPIGELEADHSDALDELLAATRSIAADASPT